MATDYKVIEAATVWHYDPSQGVKGSDKVYSVQLVENKKTGQFSVESQYGKRGYNLKSAPTTYSGTNKYAAERAYNELLQKKVKGKNGDPYDRVIDTPIIPTTFGGAGFSRAITMEQEAKTAKQVDALYNFLSDIKPTEPVVAPKPQKEKQSDGLAAMLAAFGEE